VLLQEHCAWSSEQVFYQQPSPVGQVPCRSLHRGHCLVSLLISRVSNGVDLNCISHTEKLVKVLHGEELACVSKVSMD
jgi:hypothetical protein